MPKVLTSSQIRLADEYTIQHEPIGSVDLMERASKKLMEWISGHIPVSRPIQIFAGPGNNGGDGLALARMLIENAYTVNVFVLEISVNRSKDAEINLQRLAGMKSARLNYIQSAGDFPSIPSGVLIVDALFGAGLKRPLEGLAAGLVTHLNESGEEILAVDIPSGLFGEENNSQNAACIIRAKHTLTFQSPKLAFFFAENYVFTGEWNVLDIELHKEFINRLETKWFYTVKSDIHALIKERKKFDHKGTYGHALLISGSKGKTGAAVLAARASLRAGCGLVTVHIPFSGYEIFQAALPEAMCSLDSDGDKLTGLPDIRTYDAIGIGPGIGTHKATIGMLRNLLKSSEKPLVIDADGLNILAGNKELLGFLPGNSILTPHPGEFDRLVGKSITGYERWLKQVEFATQYNVILVLKGAFTSIASPEGMVYFNSTGNQGMATAGSGDVLTGLILSLLAQGYTPVQAAVTGTYLHGLAGDLALYNESYESLIAGDIIEHIGFAFKEISS